MYIGLAARVILLRRGDRISLGDGGNAEMLARIRTHGNFAEYVPFAILLLLIAELSGTTPFWLHAAGLVPLAGRLLHAWAISFAGPIAACGIGMMLTFLSLAVSSVAAVV